LTKKKLEPPQKSEEDEKNLKKTIFFSLLSVLKYIVTLSSQLFSFEKKKLKKKKEKTKNAEEPQNHNLFSNHARTRNKSDRRVKDEEWRRLLHLINIYAWEKIYKKNINL
jgi:Ca2+/H+ antiporter